MTTAGNFVIVSSDCHAGASVLGYKPYLASYWHKEFDAWAAAYHDAWTDVDPGVTGRAVGAASGGLTANWDSDERLTDLEADGITAEVLFPNTSPPFFPSGNLSAPVPVTRQDYERRWVGLQAHNRWLVDFCSLAPGRRAGIAQIFLNDVDDAVKEIRWAKDAGLTGGILLPGVSPGSCIHPTTSRSGRHAKKLGWLSTLTPAQPGGRSTPVRGSLRALWPVSRAAGSPIEHCGT
jgi:hypothetical protein